MAFSLTTIVTSGSDIVTSLVSVTWLLCILAKCFQTAGWVWNNKQNQLVCVKNGIISDSLWIYHENKRESLMRTVSVEPGSELLIGLSQPQQTVVFLTTKLQSEFPCLAADALSSCRVMLDWTRHTLSLRRKFVQHSINTARAGCKHQHQDDPGTCWFILCCNKLSLVCFTASPQGLVPKDFSGTLSNRNYAHVFQQSVCCGSHTYRWTRQNNTGPRLAQVQCIWTSLLCQTSIF